jgi:anti-sigma factor ChrR (cupin superfamily)
VGGYGRAGRKDALILRHYIQIHDSPNRNRPVESMQLNTDLDARVVLHTPEMAWTDAPSPGVRRRMLDRSGGEVAVATSIVEYAPGSDFAEHVHRGGEELLVLDGSFSDDTGEHPAGTYLRNPPGSRHAPRSAAGCTLFVKLGQFMPGDDRSVRIHTMGSTWRPGLVPGLSVLPLHEFEGISTALVRWAPNTLFGTHSHPGGEEILVLSGVFRDEQGEYSAGTWIRSPRYSRHTPSAGAEGALIYVKVGHLGAGFVPVS